MNVPLSEVSARMTARMNGIVTMTKTMPKTGRSSLRPRRSCLLRADQLLLIRTG